MVQQLQRGPTLADAFSKGLQGSVMPALQQQYQRNLGLDALRQAKVGAAQAQTPSDLLFSLLEATAGRPGAERSLGPLYSELVKQMGARQFPTGLGEASKNVSGHPVPEMPLSEQPMQEKTSTDPVPVQKSELPKNAQFIENEASQYLAELRPDLVSPSASYGKIPTFDFEMRSDLRPEEEANIREKLVNKYNPEVVDRIINRTREDIQTRFKEAQTQYGLDKDQIEQMQNKWNVVRNNALGNAQQPGSLSPYLGKYESLQGTQEELKGKYFQYAAQQPINLTPEAINTNAMTLLQNDMNQIDALKTVPPMPPVHSAKNVQSYIDSLKDQYKPLIEKGYLEAVKEDATKNKDLGLEEMHQAIWGDQTDKTLLRRVHSIPGVPEFVPMEHGAVGMKRASNYEKKREQYIDQLSNVLKTMSEKDDLVLLRSQVLDANGTVKDFNEALQRAEEKGLKLSQFQKSQLQEVAIPRSRPLWEIFNPSAWKNWLNYIRGKR